LPYWQRPANYPSEAFPQVMGLAVVGKLGEALLLPSIVLHYLVKVKVMLA